MSSSKKIIGYSAHILLAAMCVFSTSHVGVLGQVVSKPANTNPAGTPAVANSEVDQALAAAMVAGSSAYLLRPGDELDIKSLLTPELNQTARVRPDGKISLVLVNEVQAAGHTAEEMSSILSELYSKHFRSPQVTAIVRSFSSLSVYVGGEVARPGLVALVGGGLTASAAVIQAGGFKEEEIPKRVVLLRQRPSGGPVMINLDLADVLLRGRPDTQLQPSDVLFVPKQTINVYVAGEVVQPGLIPLSHRLTAFAAVIKAQGPKHTAQLGSVMLLRDTGDGKPLIKKLDLRKVASTGVGDYNLEPYDVVFVPKAKIAKANQFVDQYIRQLIPIGMNMGFTYLLGQQFYQ